MFFKSIDDLNRDIVQNLHRIPHDIDIIVGVPRSGLFVASIIALYLNMPLVDLQGFISGRVFQSGKRLAENIFQKKIRKVLVVEDSVLSGNSLVEAKNKMEHYMKSRKIELEIIYFAAYVLPECCNIVDFYLDTCQLPRAFEWNIMHHEMIENSCFDLDGVLCIDPKPAEDDDEINYISFIKNAQPLFIPSREIGSIVTCRLEKYRDYTEDWLKRNNIRYKRLIMMNYSTKEERIRSDMHADFKAEWYKKLNAAIFIESNLKQAVEIAKLANKPVYCVEIRKIVYPNASIDDCHINLGGPNRKIYFKSKLKSVKYKVKNKMPVLYKILKLIFVR